VRRFSSLTRISTERVVALVLARRKHPGGHNALDDLCSRYRINLLRSKHGALLDAELLAAVYVELTTTRQAALLAAGTSNIQTASRTRAFNYGKPSAFFMNDSRNSKKASTALEMA
jgi:DNA polymerase III epsilon subunit-like protein